MRIEFELKDKEHIIINGVDDDGTKSQIGQIVTPSGSGMTNLNAIQICGFDEAFDLWGCGIFGDKETGLMKKDIQLCWHKRYELMSRDEMQSVCVGEKNYLLPLGEARKMKLKNPIWSEKIMKDRFSGVMVGDVCSRCFNHPCTCENLIRYDNPYTVKREQDLNLEKKNNG